MQFQMQTEGNGERLMLMGEDSRNYFFGLPPVRWSKRSLLHLSSMNEPWSTKCLLFKCVPYVWELRQHFIRYEVFFLAKKKVFKCIEGMNWNSLCSLATSIRLWQFFKMVFRDHRESVDRFVWAWLFQTRPESCAIIYNVLCRAKYGIQTKVRM